MYSPLNVLLYKFNADRSVKCFRSCSPLFPPLVSSIGLTLREHHLLPKDTLHSCCIYTLYCSWCCRPWQRMSTTIEQAEILRLFTRQHTKPEVINVWVKAAASVEQMLPDTLQWENMFDAVNVILKNVLLFMVHNFEYWPSNPPPSDLSKKIDFFALQHIDSAVVNETLKRGVLF